MSVNLAGWRVSLAMDLDNGDILDPRLSHIFGFVDFGVGLQITHLKTNAMRHPTRDRYPGRSGEQA